MSISNKIGRLRPTRRVVWGSAFVTLVAVGGLLSFSKASPVLAAACAPSTSFGTDTITFTVQTTGTYSAWVRLLSPDGVSNQVMMNVDNGTCYTMGKSMAANTWTWVNTPTGSTTPVTLSLTAGTHSVMFTGNQAGMGLDEFQFLSDPNCVPSGTTNNCTVNQPTPPTVSILSPTAGSTVSGNVTVSATASDTGSITQVVLKVDSTTLATDTTAPYSTSWDTTTATAGSHTISAIATDSAGLSTTATETVTVSNPTCTANPTAPSNLHDTDTPPLPAGKVDLGWTAGSAAANCTLAGYNVYRNGSATPLNSSPITTTTYSDATVAATTTYTYQIEAVDTAQHSSGKVPATPLSVTTGTNCAAGNGAPTTPAGLAQTLPTDYTTITLHWTASTINNGCTLTGYHVYRDGSTTPIATLGLVTSFTDNGPLASGTSHNYSVDAFDSGGNKSAGTGVIAMNTKADDMAPSSPTGFTGANLSGAVALSWTASTDLPNPGATGVKNYDIYRCTGAACTPPGETSTPNFISATTSFTDSTVAASTTYRYVVSAVDNNNNQSSQSATIVTVTTPAPTCSGAPSVPTGLNAAGATLNTISLAWTASTPAAGCTLQGYQVYRGGVLQSTVSTTSFTDSGLAPNTPYIYHLIAVETSSSNNTSPQTPDFTTSTLADTTAPSAPINFVVSAPNPTQVSLGWTAATDNVGVTGYNIYRNGALLKSVVAVTNATDTTVVANTTYTYLLEAFDAAGNKSTPKTASTPTTITTPKASDTTPPSTPGNPVAGVIGTTSVALTWTASTDNVAVAGYNVYRNGSTTPVNSSLLGTPSFTDTSLIPNTTYTYTVKAVDTSGNASSASASISVTTLAVTTPVPGDIDGNRVVDIRDFTILLIHWNQSVVANTNGDLDSNGLVDIRDLTQELIDWGLYNKANGL